MLGVYEDNIMRSLDTYLVDINLGLATMRPGVVIESVQYLKEERFTL
jgi:hypothetical protein